MLTDYYENPKVRARLVEFLGGASLARATCHYITTDGTATAHRQPHFAEELFSRLHDGPEICRSLWDRDSLVVDLDLEYVNFDNPGEVYLEPERVFDLQEPVADAVEKLLMDYKIVPLHVLSGRGHHFIWRIRQNSRAFRRLAAMGRCPSTLREINSHLHPPGNEDVHASLGSAFAGLGLLMEFLAHGVEEMAAPLCAIPVEVTAVEVGPSNRGREMVSIDISEYGDPLHSRAIRVPFSAYLKPWQLRHTLGEALVEDLPPLFFIPLHEMDSRQGLVAMRKPRMVVELAGCTSARIPDQTAGTTDLLEAYAGSPVAWFHDWFYSEEHEPPERWPETYDRTPMEDLPPCARVVLDHPNDLLLQPSGIRLVTRVMLALGWHPRQIAGLIRSKFERDYNWGDQWIEYDPASRADFYVRLFSGLFAVGRDDLVNFNCVSAKEETFCFAAECPNNLALFRKSALDRRRYDKLAHRPFNRLFLPDEHL